MYYKGLERQNNPYDILFFGFIARTARNNKIFIAGITIQVRIRIWKRK